MEDHSKQGVVKSTLGSAVTLYHQGSFTRCKTLINELKFESQKSMITQWVVENNELSTEFHLIDNDTHQKDYYCVKFYNLLNKAQSLPASVESVGLELTVQYNGLQSEQPGLRATQQRETTLRNTVNRALELRAVTGLIRVERNETVYSLLEELANTELSKCLVRDLLPVCLVWVLGLIQTDRCTEAAQILSIITRCTYATQHETQPSNVVRILESRPPLSVKVNFDLCVILLAVLTFKERKFSASRELVKGVSTTEYLSTSVFLQALCLLEESNPAEGLSVLQELDIALLQKSKVSIQARLHCLTGQCLAIQGKPRTAVLHQKAALEKDFTYLTPLYYISVMYGELHMDTAQLETLNLLATALTAEPGNSSPSSSACDSLEDQVMSVLLDTLGRRERLSSIEVQSLLASTCLHLHRYEDAYERYIELLAAAIETDVIKTEGRLIQIPELPQIFLDAITSSLKSGMLEECITLCDQAVMSHADQLPPFNELTPLSICDQAVMSHADQLSPSNEQLSQANGGSGKRKRKLSHCDNDGKTQEDYLVKYLLLKADALRRQHNLQESLTILQSVAEKLEKREFKELSEITDTNPEKRARLASDNGDANPEKRARLASDNSDAHPEKRARLVSDSADANPSKRARLASHISESCQLTESLLWSVYSQLGQVSSLLDKPVQAIHYYRLSLLLSLGTDQKDTVYRLTKSLLSVNRVQEAVVHWSEIREISSKMDTFQINREIQHRETLIQKKRSTEESDVDSAPTDCDRLKLDNVILKALLHHKHTKLWTV